MRISLPLSFTLSLLALAGLAVPASAQDAIDTKPYLGTATFGFDPTVIQPGSHIFFADKADPGELQVFNDGKLAVDLQLFGGDFVHYRRDGRFRVGINTGLGITQISDAMVLLTNASFFIQLGQYYRIDIGWMYGVSAKEGLDRSQRDRSALVVGVSFPTKLNEGLKRLLTQNES